MYPMCGFPANGGYFFLFYITLFLTSIMSYFVSMAVAGLTGDAPLAFAIVPPLFMPYGIFCGYPINLSTMNVFWGGWGPYVSFMRWTFESYVVNEFTSQGISGQEVIDYYNFHTDYIPGWTIWILILNIFCVSIITVYALQPKKSQLKRLKNNNKRSIKFDIESEQTIIDTSPLIGADENINLEPSHDNYFETSDGTNGEFGDDIAVEDIERFSLLRLDSFTIKNKVEEKSNGMEINIKNINLTTTSSDGSQVNLLNDINGVIPAGKMCAIMGANGSGKTLLLNIIRNQNKVGTVTGSILYDGQPFNPSLFRSVSFVPQSDIHLALLTVKETLYYAAELRIGNKETKQFREDRVTRILEILELTEHSNTLVGNAYIKGVSGGQKRRLSIGVEIITFPGLIILDGN